jgi:serine/threonine protein kinase
MQPYTVRAGQRVVADKDWQRAKEVLARVLEVPSGERAAALDALCGQDVDLRAYVDGLLSDYESDANLRALLATENLTPTDVGPWSGDRAHSPRGASPRGPAAGGANEPTADRRIWGEFVLLQELGRGGFGVVYRAWEQPLQREVALKLIDASVYPERRASIQREGQMLARLSHPNVVKVFGIHRDGDALAIAMEYVRGRTLADLVALNGPFPPHEAAGAAATLCGALAAVHRRGLLHRDVKASNVMRTNGGRIVLMDFGAGRDLQRDAHTRSQVIGTPLYMAPEVLAGGHATPASDVYSLGVLLYFLLRGDYPDTPVAGPPGRLVDPHWVSSSLPGVPESLAVLVARMLDPEPARRPAMNGDLKRELTRAAPRVPRVPAETATTASASEPDSAQPPEAVIVARDPASTLWRTSLACALLSPFALLAMGMLTTAEYNAVMGRADIFARESLLDYMALGAKALILPVLQTCAIAVIGACVVLLWHVARAVVPATQVLAERAVARLRERLDRAGLGDRDTFGRVLCLACLTLVVGVLWAYQPLVTALVSSIDDSPGRAFGPLSSGLDDAKGWFTMLLCGILLLLVSVTWSIGLTPGLRRGTILAMGGTAILLVVLIVAPWRTMYVPKMRVMLYEGMRCFVIGEHRRDVLLHCPARPAPRNRVVALDDRALESTPETGYLFDTYHVAALAAGQ